MTTPVVRVNTLVKSDEKHHVDNLSKMFIIVELALGLNRLPILGNIKSFFIVATLFYSAMITFATVYSTLTAELNHSLPAILSLIEFTFCNVFSFITCKRMLRYYTELNKFDMDVGCRPKIAQGSIRNIAHICLAIIFIVVLMFIPYEFETILPVLLHMIPLNFIHIFELHFYAHLLGLLIPRLRLINYYMESSLSKEVMNTNNMNEFIFLLKSVNLKHNMQMKKLMDLYQIIVTAYNYLIEAIKWQLLVIIVSTFVTVLSVCYYYSLSVIHEGNPLKFSVSYLGLTVVLMLPLFAPCLCGDRVHTEVRRLRELLASRLYENKLDKASRNMARALLALTETRDLSFSLLRMLDIDISLPFKFVGLLVTYLIILLQFEKVINP